jgi:hypothetical protein
MARENGDKYRPANGTEGMVFQEKWCNKCKRDWDEGGCEIYTRAFLFGTEDSDYPKEWIYQDEKPICTAFDHVDNPDGIASYRCPDTPDMFEQPSKDVPK